MPVRSPSSQAIDAAIQHRVKPLLKSEGFRRTGRAFHRIKDDVIQVVHVQASMWNTPDAAEFTVNLNVVLPAFHERWTGTPMPTNPASAAPICSYRIGLLMEDRRDCWWKVTPESDTETISRQVAEVIRTIGLPALNQAADLEWLLTKLRAEERFSGIVTNQTLAAAILLAYLGQMPEALQTIRQLRQRNKHAGFAKTISTIEARLTSAGER